MRFSVLVLLAACSGSAEVETRGEPIREIREARRESTVTSALRGDGAEWIRAEAGYEWSFPSDHWGHDGYRTEWWYFTGHLNDSRNGEARFGYQVTFFKVGLAPVATEYDSNWSTDSLVMAHFALSDLERADHRFAESIHRVGPAVAGIGREPDPRLIWVRAPAGGPGVWSLDWNGEGFDMAGADARQAFGLELSTRPAKPRIFQGPGGLSRKGDRPEQASLYYSYTRLETTGTVRVDGEEVPVQGQSWMDKEFGSSLLGDNQVGWDWFSLQLDDGEELMIYVLRNPRGDVDHASGTRILVDGSVEYFDEDAWTIQVNERWRSESGGDYPVSWTVKVSDRTLEIRANFDDQENRGTLISDLAYWEGAVEIRDSSGAQIGRGFVEMTGYGEGTRSP